MQQFLKFYYLIFMYSSTCFRGPSIHHQELNNCSSTLWFYSWSVVVALLLVVIGPAGPTTSNSTQTEKPEAATAVVELLMMGGRTPETC